MADKKSPAQNTVTKETFGQWVEAHQAELRSFLYRFTASKEEAEDLVQETFAKAYQKIDSFQGKSSFKTWLFAIGINLAKDHNRSKKRWPEDAQDQCKAMISSTPDLVEELHTVNQTSEHGKYEIREHIDFCFTCIMKTLPLEQHLALMLADIYAFKVKEIATILETTTGTVKHYLHNARSTMQDIFEHRCALVSKKGMCHQCSELNGFANSKADTQRAITDMELVKAAQNPDKNKLFTIRTELVKAIDPLQANGTDFHDFLLKCTRKALKDG